MLNKEKLLEKLLELKTYPNLEKISKEAFKDERVLKIALDILEAQLHDNPLLLKDLVEEYFGDKSSRSYKRFYKILESIEQNIGTIVKLKGKGGNIIKFADNPIDVLHKILKIIAEYEQRVVTKEKVIEKLEIVRDDRTFYYVKLTPEIVKLLEEEGVDFYYQLVEEIANRMGKLKPVLFIFSEDSVLSDIPKNTTNFRRLGLVEGYIVSLVKRQTAESTKVFYQCERGHYVLEDNVVESDKKLYCPKCMSPIKRKLKLILPLIETTIEYMGESPRSFNVLLPASVEELLKKSSQKIKVLLLDVSASWVKGLQGIRVSKSSEFLAIAVEYIEEENHRKYNERVIREFAELPLIEKFYILDRTLFETFVGNHRIRIPLVLSYLLAGSNKIKQVVITRGKEEVKETPAHLNSLFIGLPGTGKSEIAKRVIKKIYPHLEKYLYITQITPSSVVAAYEKGIIRLGAEPLGHGKIIIYDEFDKVSNVDEVVSYLLTCMSDGIYVRRLAAFPVTGPAITQRIIMMNTNKDFNLYEYENVEALLPAIANNLKMKKPDAFLSRLSYVTISYKVDPMAAIFIDDWYRPFDNMLSPQGKKVLMEMTDNEIKAIHNLLQKVKNYVIKPNAYRVLLPMLKYLSQTLELPARYDEAFRLLTLQIFPTAAALARLDALKDILDGKASDTIEVKSEHIEVAFALWLLCHIYNLSGKDSYWRNLLADTEGHKYKSILEAYEELVLKQQKQVADYWNLLYHLFKKVEIYYYILLEEDKQFRHFEATYERKTLVITSKERFIQFIYDLIKEHYRKEGKGIDIYTLRNIVERKLQKGEVVIMSKTSWKPVDISKEIEIALEVLHTRGDVIKNGWLYEPVEK